MLPRFGKEPECRIQSASVGGLTRGKEELASEMEQTGMYGCDLLFSRETAENVREVVMKLPGGCVCETGGWCPLLPKNVLPLLDRVLPIPAAVVV